MSPGRSVTSVGRLRSLDIYVALSFIFSFVQRCLSINLQACLTHGCLRVLCSFALVTAFFLLVMNSNIRLKPKFSFSFSKQFYLLFDDTGVSLSRESCELAMQYTELAWLS